jgi:hypothetical protein
MADGQQLRVPDILASGPPFVHFPEHSIVDLPYELGDWVEQKLRQGVPFVIRGFEKLRSWDAAVLNAANLIALLPPKGMSHGPGWIVEEGG